MQGIGDLPGGNENSRALGVSADGSASGLATTSEPEAHQAKAEEQSRRRLRDQADIRRSCERCAEIAPKGAPEAGPAENDGDPGLGESRGIRSRADDRESVIWDIARGSGLRLPGDPFSLREKQMDRLGYVLPIGT